MTQFEKIFQFMKKPWVFVLYAILVVMVYIFLDKPLAIYFHQLGIRTNIYALSVLTALGQSVAYIVLFLAAAVYFRFIRTHSAYEAQAWYLLGCVLLANVVCFILKVTLSRARPDLLFAQNEFGFYWFQWSKFYWSFPSGHTTTVISLAVGLGVLFPRYFYWAFFIGLLVAVSRVLLYYHYLSDVLSAIYLSLIVVGLFTEYLKKNHALDEKTGRILL